MTLQLIADNETLYNELSALLHDKFEKMKLPYSGVKHLTDEQLGQHERARAMGLQAVEEALQDIVRLKTLSTRTAPEHPGR